LYIAAFDLYTSVICSVAEGQCGNPWFCCRMMWEGWKKVAIKRCDSREILVVYEAM
jgi:hypothetical protein